MKTPTNRKILSVDSPQDKVGGPYAVVYKDEDGQSAEGISVIVAMDWHDEPCFGIRWFNKAGEVGHPSSRGNSTWQVIPRNVGKIILSGLDVDDPELADEHDIFSEFLDGKISGKKLRYLLEQFR